MGYVLATDTAAVNRIITQYGGPILPADLKLAWSFKPYEPDTSYQGPERFELIALRTSYTSGDRKTAMTGESIEKASSENSKKMGYLVNVRFNDEGARVLSRLTSQNIGKHIAFVVKDKVYSYPQVMNRVDGGRVQITGNFTEEEAHALVDFIYGK